MASIYGLCDPRDGALRYIGKANDPKRRLASHLRDARRRDTPVYRWIRKLLECGLVPVLSVLETSDDWIEAERRLIAEARARGERLLNVADGGDEPKCDSATRKRNGHGLAQRLLDDPVLSANRLILRRYGQLQRDMVKVGRPDRAASLAEKLVRLKDWARRDPDMFLYRMGQSPMLRRAAGLADRPELFE